MQTKMYKELIDFVKKYNLLQAGHPVLLAVSGGLDSMVMCELFSHSPFPFAIAHCNFQLRGKAAQADEKLVKSAAYDKYQVPFFNSRFEVKQYANKHNVSIQMAARELRYEWLETIRRKEGYHFIATAHHQDDVIETMLYNLSRGTGIAGLHGIRPKTTLTLQEQKVKLIRPLLFTHKKALRDFAERHQISFRKDKSNESTDYDRNYIRHQVVPALKELNPDLPRTFWENSEKIREAEAIYRHNVQRLTQKVCHYKGEEVFVDYHKLLLYPGAKTLLYEILQYYNFNHKQVQIIYEGLKNQPGQQYFSSTHRLIKDRQYLIITTKNTDDRAHALIQDGQRRLSIAPFKLSLEIVKSPHFKIPNRKDIACLDYDKLTFPLLLRPWRAGDYFYPLGMNGKKKKIKALLTDEKASLLEKERTWVLLSGQKIVWVVGYRIDQRFRVTSSTQNVLKIKYFTRQPT